MRIILGIIFLFSPLSFAGDIDEMVMDVSAKHNIESIKLNAEFYGVILSDEDGVLTHTVDRSSRGKELITFSIKRKPSQKIVAIWHTHGSHGAKKKYFSKYDTAAAVSYSVPIYMMDSTFILRVYHPGDKTMAGPEARRKMLYKGSAEGDVVGRYIEDKIAIR